MEDINEYDYSEENSSVKEGQNIILGKKMVISVKDFHLEIPSISVKKNNHISSSVKV